MTLGELRLGHVFRTTDGRVGVRWRWEAGNREDRRLACLWLDGHGFNTTLPVATPVEPLDLPALLEEHALFRRLLEDVGQDQGYSVGVWAERGEVVRMLEKASERMRGQSLECATVAEEAANMVAAAAIGTLAVDISARGPAAAPPERVLELERKAARLEEALRGLVGATLNGMTARGLPHEWVAESALGIAHAALAAE
jgi:hypothetical protein